MLEGVTNLALGAISLNPATGVLTQTYPFQTAAEIERVLVANKAAFEQWRATTLAHRVMLYKRLAITLRDRSESLAMLATSEMGKTIGEARAEVEKCAATIAWMSEHGPGILADEPVETETEDRAYVSFLPIGTVLAVMPWNFAFWQAIRAAGPIMLSGNGFLLKHAPNVMGCACALRDAYEASGFPEHLFAILNAGNDAVTTAIEDSRIAAVTVTGSMRAGSAMAGTAGKAMKKSLLELGGADAYIVLADADIDKAVEAGIKARFQNAGQVCLAAKRFILERSIAEAFTRKYVEAVRKVKAGDPLDPATTIGPIARDDLRDGIHGQVERSIAAGATLLLSGDKIDGPGFFYQPTVLADVRPGIAAFDEEVLGPVAALVVAGDADDAIRLTNASEYGLSSNIWTKDLDKARTLARRIEAGGVFVNGFSASNPRIPVGGVKSGYGRELSHFGLREFTNAQVDWVEDGRLTGPRLPPALRRMSNGERAVGRLLAPRKEHHVR